MSEYYSQRYQLKYFCIRFGEFKLGDFGIARELERTMSGLSKKGTYSYMAPEMYKGEAYDSRVDIYSLGIVFIQTSESQQTSVYQPGKTADYIQR